MRKQTLAATLTVLLLGVGSGCDPAPEPTPTRSPELTSVPVPTPRPTAPSYVVSDPVLRWNLGEEPATLDPALAQTEAEVDLVRQLFLGLTAYDPETGAPVPELATGWDVTENGEVYTFHLRPGVRWVRYHPQTGRIESLRPVTAHDVIYSLRRAVHPATGSPTAHVLDVIQNARAIRTAPITDTLDVQRLGVAALDDHTVRVTLEHPAATLPAILALPVARPVRPELPPNVYQWQPGHPVEVENLITNGPFVFDISRYTSGSVTHVGITMGTNPEYYDVYRMPASHFYSIALFMEPQQTALAMYEAGELDSVVHPIQHLDRTPSPEAWMSLAKQLRLVPTGGVCYLGFNLSRSPLDDVHVRRALSYALDRETAANVLFWREGAKEAVTFAPPGVWGSVAEADRQAPRFDPEKAREELSLAGYRTSADRLRLRVTLLYPATELDTRIAQYAQANWKEHLDVEVILIDEETWRADPERQPPHVWLGHWPGGDYPDQHAYVHEFLRTPPWTEFNKDTPALEPLLNLTAAAGVELDPNRRLAMYSQAEDWLVDEVCALAVLFHDARIVLTRTRLHRDYPLMGGQNLKDWWFEPEE